MDPYAQALLDAVDTAIGPWVQTQVTGRLRAAGRTVDDAAVAAAAVAAGREAHDRLVALLSADVDDQRTNPLEVLRGVAHHATAVLAAADVAPARRDEVARRLHPDDAYDLGPAAWRDLGDDVHDAGLAWGASKAMAHLRRHRSPEQGR